MIPRILCLRDHHFYTPLVHRNSSVVDLGANKGDFSKLVTEKFSCQSYAIEANPYLFALIESSPAIKKFNYAITDKPGELTFNISANPEAGSLHPVGTMEFVETVKVRGISLPQFLNDQGLISVDLIKIDIEGAEIQLFDSLTDKDLKKIKQITIELHDFFYDSDLRPMIQQIVARLQRLGFLYINFTAPVDNTDTLFVNKAFLSLTELVELLFFKYVRLNVRRLLRQYKNISRN